MHYAWKILIACCSINASALGLTNSNGLFYTEICKDLGIRMSNLTIHTIVTGLVSVATLTIVDKAYKKLPIRPLLMANLILYHVAYMSMAFFNRTFEWCIASVFTGISGAFLLYIPVPMLLNNWFVKKKKTALSICFVASGVSGILVSLLLGYVISSYGWRTGYIVRGIFLLVITIPVLLFVKKDPKEAGMLPYGAGEDAKEEQKIMGESAESHTFDQKRIKYLSAIFLAIAFNLGCAMVTQLPNYANTRGLGIVMGSYLTSLAMAGNILSKAMMGPVVEKSGVRISGACVAGFIALGYFAIAGGARAVPLVCAVAFTTGFTACTNTLIIPNLLDTFVKGDDYVHVLSRCSMGTMLAGAFTNVIASSLFDCFGRYEPVFFIYGILEVVSIMVLLLVFRKK